LQPVVRCPRIQRESHSTSFCAAMAMLTTTAKMAMVVALWELPSLDFHGPDFS
jgi:hypothetical protein